MIIERKVRFGLGRRKKVLAGSCGGDASAARVPRVTRLMALAIRFDQLIRDGVVADQAEMARIGHVSRARLTQVMNLLCLAPKLQEEILCFPATDRDRDAITERDIRPIAAETNWQKQKKMWRLLTRCY